MLQFAMFATFPCNFETFTWFKNKESWVREGCFHHAIARPPYLLDAAPSDDHLFLQMQCGLLGSRSDFKRKANIDVDSWVVLKQSTFLTPRISFACQQTCVLFNKETAEPIGSF